MGEALIADDVIRLALYPVNEGWALGAEGTPKVPSYLGPAVSVALLADLALAGVIRIDHDRVSATGIRGERVELAATVAQIARHGRSRSTRSWARRLAGTRPELHRLVALRRLNAILQVDPAERQYGSGRQSPYWFIREDDPGTARILGRLNDALRAGSADDRTTALLAIMYGCGLHRAYFRDRSDAERDQLILGVVADHWAWRTTRQCAKRWG